MTFEIGHILAFSSRPTHTMYIFDVSQIDLIHRITWTYNEDKSVTQLWEILNLNRDVDNNAFLGIYRLK